MNRSLHACLQHIDKNHFRVKHYAGYRNGKPKFKFRRQEPDYIHRPLVQKSEVDLVDHCSQSLLDHHNIKDSDFFNKFQADKTRAGSSAWNECLTCTQGTLTINWAEYGKWLSQSHVPKYTNELLRYSKKYAYVLDQPEKASDLNLLSRDLRRLVMASLANLSKYLGMYSSWRQLVKNNGLKWERRSALETFVDIFECNLDDVRQWLSQVVQELPPKYATVEVFTALTGLRPSEAVNSCRLIVELSSEDRLCEYLDQELMMLKHFKFKDLFLRGCKSTYVSFITQELLDLVLRTEPVIKYATLHSKLRRLGFRNRTKQLRKLYATTLRNYVPHEVVDLLQGRINQSVFLRFYYKPFLEDIRKRSLEGIKPLQNELLPVIS